MYGFWDVEIEGEADAPHQARGWTYFADVYESTHEVLVTERVDRLLGLLPRCVFHNSATDVSTPKRLSR